MKTMVDVEGDVMKVWQKMPVICLTTTLSL